MTIPTITNGEIISGGRFFVIESDMVLPAVPTVANTGSKMPVFVASGGAVTVATDGVSGGYIVWQVGSRVCYGLSRVVGISEDVDVTIAAAALTHIGDNSPSYSKTAITIRNAQPFANLSDTDPGSARWGTVTEWHQYWVPFNVLADLTMSTEGSTVVGGYWDTSGFPKGSSGVESTILINGSQAGRTSLGTLRLAWQGGAAIDSSSASFYTASGTSGSVQTSGNWFYVDVDTSTATGTIGVKTNKYNANGFTDLRVFNLDDVHATNPYETKNIWSTKFATTYASMGVHRFMAGMNKDNVHGLGNVAKASDSVYTRLGKAQFNGVSVPEVISLKRVTDLSNWGKAVNDKSETILECVTDIAHGQSTGDTLKNDITYKLGEPTGVTTAITDVGVIYVVNTTTFQILVNGTPTVSTTSQTLDTASPLLPGLPPMHPEDAVEICNGVGIRCWYCIPPHWSDADIDAVGDALTAATQPVYIEISNEAWNGSFSQLDYFGMVQAANVELTTERDGYAFEANRVFVRIRARFALAGKETDAIRVLGGQAAAQGVGDSLVAISITEGYVFDAYAVAPYQHFDDRFNNTDQYIGLTDGTNVFSEDTDTWVEAELTGADVASFSDWYAQDSFILTTGDIYAARDLVDNNPAIFVLGHLYAYESGYEKVTKGDTTGLQALSTAALVHDWMAWATLSTYQQMRDVPFEVICWFDIARVDNASDGFAFGIYHDQTLTPHAKGQAFLDMATPAGGSPPPAGSISSGSLGPQIGPKIG